MLATGQFHDLEEIRNTVVAVDNESPIRLRDIAEVRDGVEDPRILVYGNGQPGALISISRQIGGNILQVADQVKALAGHLGSAIPSTLHLSLVYDLAEFVREAVASVRDAVLIGALLAVAILFLFLREVRSTFIAAVSLPIAVIGTFFFMKLFGGTLNLMSLGGMAIAIGLVIDDAVVIVENIYRHLGMGDPPPLAAEQGTRELLGPVVGSTVTTVVVFAPLSLLRGVVGEFFSALCQTLVISVTLSLILAVVLIPLFAEQFLKPRHHQPKSERFIQPVYRGYERLVRWALRHRGVVTVGGNYFYRTQRVPRHATGNWISARHGRRGLCFGRLDTSRDFVGSDQSHQSPDRGTGSRDPGGGLLPAAHGSGDGAVCHGTEYRRDRCQIEASRATRTRN